MTQATRANPLANFLLPRDRRSDDAIPAVDRILDAVRKHLGMDIAFASRFVHGRREFTHVRSDGPAPARPGDSDPQEDSYCYRILQGRLPELIHDASEHEAALDVPATLALPIGSHLNVPLRLSDGSLYGSFCCLSHVPDRTLTERDMDTMRAFAALAAGQIERDMHDDAERQESIARIREVVAGESLEMNFQPIHRLDGGRPVGVEALARFHDPQERSPDRWFAEAAAVGLGGELELLALRLAIRALPYIPADLYLAVNLSPATVLEADVAGVIASVPPGRLVIEVTEHASVADYGALCRALDGLKSHARIAIDDVGAGYSGLRSILDLKPDILKLDMSLTRDVDSDAARAALAQAMVAFAGGIGCRIVAEGIETKSEMEALARLGIGYGQGYYFSRPMPAVATQQFLIGARAAAPEEPRRARVRRRA
jgi:EAL domain-containing protein (putative c-di-GMP-specific phosphodiesterase class I)